MNQKQALETLIALDDCRSYCVSCSEWYHSAKNGGVAIRKARPQIAIFTKTGLHAEPFFGDTLEEALDQAIEFIKTENAATPC